MKRAILFLALSGCCWAATGCDGGSDGDSGAGDADADTGAECDADHEGSLDHEACEAAVHLEFCAPGEYVELERMDTVTYFVNFTADQVENVYWEEDYWLEVEAWDPPLYAYFAYSWGEDEGGIIGFYDEEREVELESYIFGDTAYEVSGDTISFAYTVAGEDAWISFCVKDLAINGGSDADTDSDSDSDTDTDTALDTDELPPPDDGECMPPVDFDCSQVTDEETCAAIVDSCWISEGNLDNCCGWNDVADDCSGIAGHLGCQDIVYEDVCKSLDVCHWIPTGADAGVDAGWDAGFDGGTDGGK